MLHDVVRARELALRDVAPATILNPRALVSFGQRLKPGALETLPSGCHKVYDIR